MSSNVDGNENNSKPEEGENVDEEDEEEEEDVDFNPFLKGTSSPEASSSLSSDVEGLHGGGAENSPNSRPTADNGVQNYPVGDSEHGEEVVVNDESEKKRRGLMDVTDGEEDAICKRTRARYSLTSFTLDELETFLQETDDEDDLHNIDDEEEYRKFLAAVLQGDEDGEGLRENGNVDEDEESDADFEIELEELLESDADDGKVKVKDPKGEYGRGGRRPETRQDKRQRAAAQYEKRLLEQSKRPLRPLLPVLPNGGFTPFPTSDRNALTSVGGSYFVSSLGTEGLINGFTLQQIGQLHCLIHEHAQLLIQVFSLSVVDVSRQHVASQVEKLISELVHKRDEAAAHRSLPYPDLCFRPPNVCPSVVNELPNYDPALHAIMPSPTMNLQTSIPQNSPSTGRHQCAASRQMHCSQSLGSFWVPFVSGPITSILDVAPLNLVQRYVEDVHNAMREYRKQQLTSGSDSLYQREPLFCFPSLATTNGEVLQGDAPSSTSTVLSTPGQQQPKKTLAASIVEKVKKQSIALVPKDISTLAQRFFPLFNPALFPHKPPPSAVANRILFTDTEDELLALGILEFNNDWKAIQQRFFPCKSKHQIFVRQKNRSSSKAPENPIKAVRRMKTSPLTAEEIERIQEGHRIFKSDWMSVWRFAVPYRDPSLLPRQWRIALGTQRSYRKDAAVNEKRRIYESNRRLKAADLVRRQLESEKDNLVDHMEGENTNTDECADDANEAYVHQAFLADWRTEGSGLGSFDQPCTEVGVQNCHGEMQSRGGTHKEQQNHFRAGEVQPIYWIDSTHGFPYASNICQYPHTSDISHVGKYSSTTMQPIHKASGSSLNPSKSHLFMLPRRTRRTGGARLVRLAPELPPVNLPPSVRVIPQSAFKSNQHGVPMKVSASGGVMGDARKANRVLLHRHLNTRTNSSAQTESNKGNQVTDKIMTSSAEEQTSLRTEDCMVVCDSCAVDERGSEAVLEMHPLLFQAPEDGRVPYYPMSSSIGASSYFSLFSGNQPQLNLTLLHKGKHIDHLDKSSRTSMSDVASCGIDFHPLLQRTDDENNASMTASSNAQLVCLGDKSRQSQNPVDAIQFKSVIDNSPHAGGFKHSGHYEKANELDLGISLSSTSLNEKMQGSRDGDTYDQSIPSFGAPNCGSTVGTREANGTWKECRDDCHTVKSIVVAAATASAVPGNFGSRCDIDDIDDHSHPEIVMEKEELSDSEDEIEENVEFECEEMADSDGEGLLGEPLPGDQDKTPSSIEEVTIGSKCAHQQTGVRSPGHPQGDTSIPRKGSPILKLSLTSLRKDTTTSSWLSLDSGAPAHTLSMKAKHQLAEANDAHEAENLYSCRPNRSCKKTSSSTKRVVTQKNVMDMAQQLSLGPLAVSTLKKPRKRASQANTSLSNEMRAGTSISGHD